MCDDHDPLYVDHTHLLQRYKLNWENSREEGPIQIQMSFIDDELVHCEYVAHCIHDHPNFFTNICWDNVIIVGNILIKSALNIYRCQMV